MDKLLTAFAHVSRRRPGLSLAVVGSGPEQQRLRALAEDLGPIDVEFRGFVDQAGLPAHYAQADAFVFPTLDDPFGIALLEAAAAGLPLVASRYAGATADLVRHGETGFVVDPTDSGELAQALVAVAEDPQLRSSMGRAAHRATLDRTPEAAASGYAEAVEAGLRAG